MGVLKSCKPRKEVLKGDLDDAIFAADFGDLISGKAPKVYGDAKTFFQNTHPAKQLCKVIEAVFERLADPKEAGATLRLSTGFGGGKTHTLMALWHLARNIANPSMGTEVLPAAGRPKSVTVVAVDLGKSGHPIFSQYGKIKVHSLWGDIAFKLGGDKALKLLGEADHPERQPTEQLISKWFPSGPVLILLDEIVVYMAALSEQGQGNLLAFLNKLASVVSKRPQTVLVVTDPADQRAYAKQAQKLGDAKMAAAIKLNDVFGRKMTDFDPIGDEAAKVIVRRLFEKVDSAGAQSASAAYHSLYERVLRESPGCLPPTASSTAYSKKIVECYPFHPRLMETAQGRLGALQEFNKSRGTLRLFARLLRTIWESDQDLELIKAGDVDWSSPRIQADLLHRLNRDNFMAAITADLEKHAADLDGGATRGIHVRVASALLLESIPMQSNSGLDPADLTLTVLRPDEAGPEPSEALDRLVGMCWHTYPIAGGRGWQFRYEPNIIKQIEERMNDIPLEDARSRVLAEAQGYFQGPAFKLAAWPANARQVPESADLQLALCETELLAKSICEYSDDSNPQAPIPRRFRNAILAVTATPTAFNSAVEKSQRLMAAESIEKEHKSGEAGKLVRDQLQRIKPELQKQFRIQTCRAFDRVIFTGGLSYPIEEKYQVSDEQILQRAQGQSCLRRYLEEKGLIYIPGDTLDVGRFVKDVLPGATPRGDQPGVYTARAVHERFLSAPNLRLIPDGAIVRQTLLKAVAEGKIVIKLSDGRAYDKNGCVEGPAGCRRRIPGTLATLPLDDSVLVTQKDSEIAAAWLKEEKPAGKVRDKDDIVFPPPPAQSRVQASTWAKAIEYARERPLLKLDLIASSPVSALSLLSLAQPLGGETLMLSISVDGALKDGGMAYYRVENVKATHPLKPLDIGQKIYTSTGGGGSYEAILVLGFGESGRTGIDSQLAMVAEEAPEAITLIAYFDKPLGAR
jgi:hypothetical protein